MALVQLSCQDFRCLESLALEFSEGNNLIVGPNAAGKTSILEATAYLGRARSFRGANHRELIRHGCQEFLVTGRIRNNGREIPLGVKNGPTGLEVHTAGEKRQSAASLAELLPLQVIDPEVHELVAGGPDGRRRYVDWMAFHVEQSYLDAWRRFRRALRQRNTALKDRASAPDVDSWTRELATLGESIDAARQRTLALAGPTIERVGAELLGHPIEIRYQRGWPPNTSLEAAMMAGLERDRQLQSTQAGPHRADLVIRYEDHRARKRVSRGQQKLLACGLLLGASEIVQEALGQPLLLLLDDPSAELDRHSVARLMAAVEALKGQVIATSLDEKTPLFATAPTLFHVEQGVVRPAA